MGGGQTRVALIDRLGHVHRDGLAKTLRGRPALATLEPYLRVIDSLYGDAQAASLQVCGIGVSVPGSLDSSARRPLLVPLLPALNGFPLADFLETRYQKPVFLYSDVDATLLAEQRFGAGRNSSRLFLLTANAVVGAAFLSEGELLHSSHHPIGHICHLPVTPGGTRCSCGKRGCINTLVSMDAIGRMVQRALRRGDETSLTQRLRNREYFSLQLLAEEARRNDSVALWVYHEISRWLGAAIVKYLDLFEPHVIMLGGELLQTSNLLFSHIHSSLSTAMVSSEGQAQQAQNKHGATNVCTKVEIVPALLGRDAPLLGSVTSLIA